MARKTRRWSAKRVEVLLGKLLQLYGEKRGEWIDARSYEDAQVLTNNKGLVVRIREQGENMGRVAREFQVTIVQSR
jgi:hypothetical protein